MDPNIRKRIECYLNELTKSDWEDAWHSLVEMGLGALPYIIQAFEQGCDRDECIDHDYGRHDSQPQVVMVPREVAQVMAWEKPEESRVMFQRREIILKRE